MPNSALTYGEVSMLQYIRLLGLVWDSMKAEYEERKASSNEDDKDFQKELRALAYRIKFAIVYLRVLAERDPIERQIYQGKARDAARALYDELESHTSTQAIFDKIESDLHISNFTFYSGYLAFNHYMSPREQGFRYLVGAFFTVLALSVVCIPLLGAFGVIPSALFQAEYVIPYEMVAITVAYALWDFGLNAEDPTLMPDSKPLHFAFVPGSTLSLHPENFQPSQAPIPELGFDDKKVAPQMDALEFRQCPGVALQDGNLKDKPFAKVSQ